MAKSRPDFFRPAGRDQRPPRLTEGHGSPGRWPSLAGDQPARWSSAAAAGTGR